MLNTPAETTLRLTEQISDSTHNKTTLSLFTLVHSQLNRDNIKVVTSLSPGCSWFWPHWDHQGPACTRRSPGHGSSSTPLPRTCPGSGKAGPGCSAVWPHLGGPSPGPDGKQEVNVLSWHFTLCLSFSASGCLRASLPFCTSCCFHVCLLQALRRPNKRLADQ